MLSKLVAGLRRTMLHRDDWNWFLSAKRGNAARIACSLSVGIRSRPTPIASTAIPEWVIATSGSLWRALGQYNARVVSPWSRRRPAGDAGRYRRVFEPQVRKLVEI